MARNQKQVGSFEDRFIARLQRLTAGEDRSISNPALRQELGWKDDRYEKTKASLIRKGKIRPAQGPGGAVRLIELQAPPTPAQPIKPTALKAFISYAHADENIKRELVKHITPIAQLGYIEIWDDRQIKPGSEWKAAISDKLDSADIIILLISVDFINSDYCYSKEMTRAMERHENKEATVFPVIARQCLWHHAPFGKLQALPSDGKAITSHHTTDDPLTAVAEAILKHAKAACETA
ncbi:toll/interleukin-1 receptor domain-containing protein [Ancylobacter sp.]|uniref:toll/interleukin-1 receptor domain-containing protein n=1 Tax=Ancylobacter sp. TaxID=1872567 RepID=UPI003BA9A0B7